MTYEKVLKVIEECGLNVSSTIHEECMEKIKESLEKQIPKKAVMGYTCKANNTSWRSCLVCHARQHNTNKFCSQCGQALDFVN